MEAGCGQSRLSTGMLMALCVHVAFDDGGMLLKI